MPTAEEIMLTFMGSDKVSNVAADIGGNVQNMSSHVKSATSNAAAGFQNIGYTANNVLSNLNNGKSASDLIFGTSSKAETNSVLLKMMSSTEKAASKLNEHVDNVTNSNLVSMQSLIPAMNAFKTATGATDDEIYNATSAMASFGSKVLAQTGSVDLAEQAMMDLSKGIKGACASLDQYGITEDALKNTGLWKGDEKDIQGFMAAVEQLTGDTSDLMETNEGLDALIGKRFSSAGKKLGNEILPVIKDIKKGFLGLDDSLGGGLTASFLMISEGISMAEQGFFTLNTICQGVDNVKDAWKDVSSVLSGVKDHMKNITNTTETVANTSEVTSEVFSGVSKNDLKDAQTMGSFSGSGVDIDLDEIVASNQYKNIENYTTQMKNKEKSLKLFEESFEKGHMDESQYKSLKNKIETERDMMSDLFKNTGQLPDMDIDVSNTKKVVEGAEEIAESGAALGPAAASAKTASSGAASFSGAFAGFGAGLGSMLVPLLTVAAVVAIMIPVVVGIAAEALIFIRGLGTLIEALNFDSLDLSGVTEKISQISNALLEVGKSLLIMTGINILAGLYAATSLFTGLLSPVESTVRELKKAVVAINCFKDTEDIDETIPTKLQILSNSLRTVGDTMKVLGDVTFTTMMGNLMTLGGLFGSFSTNIQAATDDLKTAVTCINNMELDNIDENKATQLSSVCDSLNVFGQAISSIGDIQWANFMNNVNPFSNVSEAIQSSKQNIIDASNALSSFGDLKPIPEGVSQTLSNVSQGLQSAADALKSLQTINDVTGFDWLDPNKNLNDDLLKARGMLFRTAEIMSGFADIKEVPDGIKEKLMKVGSSTATMQDTLKPLIAVSEMGVDSSNINYNMQQARYAISNASTHIASLAGITPIPDGIKEKLMKVGSSTATMQDTLKPLMEMGKIGVDASNINYNMQQARYAISNASTHIASLAGIASIPDTVVEKINKVINATPNISRAAFLLSNIPATTVSNVGFAVTSIKDAIIQLNQLSSLSLDGGIEGILSSVTNALIQLKTTLSTMSGGFYTPGFLIGSSISNGLKDGLNGLYSAITGIISNSINSNLASASAGGVKIGLIMTNAFKSNLKLVNVMQNEMTYVKQAVDKGISSAKTAAMNGAKEIVNEFKRGIEVGSPGAMAWAMFDEMGYIKDFIISEGKHATYSARKLAENIVTNFGNPKLQIGYSKPNFATETMGSVETMVSHAPTNTASPVEIHIHEGAIQLDARNLTTHESKQIMINALEGLDAITNISI